MVWVNVTSLPQASVAVQVLVIVTATINYCIRHFIEVTGTVCITIISCSYSRVQQVLHHNLLLAVVQECLPVLEQYYLLQ